jgi:hypothetical protein
MGGVSLWSHIKNKKSSTAEEQMSHKTRRNGVVTTVIKAPSNR